jgi:hypothetical protein
MLEVTKKCIETKSTVTFLDNNILYNTTDNI